VKSLELGGQETLGNEIEITAASGPLKVVMGTKLVQVAVSVSPPPTSSGSLTAVAWTDTSSLQQNFQISAISSEELKRIASSIDE
jgi:hypothetical protein